MNNHLSVLLAVLLVSLCSGCGEKSVEEQADIQVKRVAAVESPVQMAGNRDLAGAQKIETHDETDAQRAAREQANIENLKKVIEQARLEAEANNAENQLSPEELAKLEAEKKEKAEQMKLAFLKKIEEQMVPKEEPATA